MAGKNTRAISYLELMLVLGIMAIMAAIAAPRVSMSMTHYRVERAAWHLAADLAYAQTRARCASRTQTVVFDSLNEQVTLPGVERLDHHAGDYRLNLKDGLYGVDQVQVQFINDANGVSTDTLAFDMWGVPQCGTPLSALKSGTILLTLGDESQTLSIAPVTGKVSLE